MCRQGALRNIIQSHQDLFRSGEVYPGTPLDGVSQKKNMKKMMFLGVAQLIWETSRYGQPPLLTMPQMSSVQKPLTIPVYSHSLPPKFPPCFRGLGFGFRGDMCVCAHPIVILYMHKRFRGASANGLRILASAGPSAALPRLSFSFREGIVVDDFG